MRYCLKRDIVDKRDRRYKKPARFFLPRSIDLRQTCSAVEDQGNLGSCTANALAGNVEYLQNKVFDSSHLGNLSDASRLFIYYNERLLEGTVDQDAGATIRSGIKSLARWGVCPEKNWPYDVGDFKKTPGQDCYLLAAERKITSYARLSGVADMIACLAEGYPVVFGISIYDSFESTAVANTGIVPMPGSAESSLGGHAVMAVGYDMDRKWFIVRNSWGPKWGKEGYFYLPFDYVKALGMDMWTIRAQEIPPAEPVKAARRSAWYWLNPINWFR